jgi:colanic acid/amylovoran biosynthesis glycosyltransferase
MRTCQRARGARPKGVPTSAPPVAAIFRSPLFNPSEGFVQAQAAALTRYRPLLVGLEDKGNAVSALADKLLLAERPLSVRLGAVRALAEQLRPRQPALIHAHFATDGLLALPLARRLGVPLVTTLHGYDVHRSRTHMLLSGRLSWLRYALLRRRLLEQGALFLAVSDALRQAAIARGFPAERIVTHHIGIDLDRFRAGEPEPGLILHVGRLVEKKGATVLLDAMGRLPEARLVIIGDGPLRDALERRATGLGDRIRFLGALPPTEVAAWMGRAWLLAAPSVTAADGDAEGLPTVIVEAAAASLPAVGTHHSGIPEAIVDGETGFVVPERDPDALAERIARLLGSAELRHRMGAAARALAERKFDLRRQTALLEELYDGVRQIRSRRRR